MTETALPKEYADLLSEVRKPLPKILAVGLSLFGTVETPGDKSNPVLISWADELGGRIDKTFQNDGVAWCGLFVAICAHRSGKSFPESALWARSWLNWGERARVPKLGDVVVFSRGETSGHVGLYVGEDATHFHVLGGNQDDAVNIRRISRTRFLGARYLFKINAPASRRRVRRTSRGTISLNEA